MATTPPSKLTSEERKLIAQALGYAIKGSQRAVTTSTEDVLKNHHQSKVYQFQGLLNRFTTNELDLS